MDSTCGNIDFLKSWTSWCNRVALSETARALKPEVAIASAGKNNRYGHPKREAVTILGVLAQFLLHRLSPYFPEGMDLELSVQHAKVDTDLGGKDGQTG